jgi:putative SOS response-associated peptidase YedK
MRGRGRALVVVSGFYEWHGREHPFEAHRPGGGLFALAAVWDGDSCAILTQPSRAGLTAVHDRMPLVVPPERFGEWLSAGPTPEIVAGIRASQGLADRLEIRPVSTWVNNPRHDDARCLEAPISPLLE